MRLCNEGARLHIWANFIPHQGAVGEAQGSICLKVDRLMVIKVHGIIPAHAQDTAALGLSGFSTPEHRGSMQGPGGQTDASHEASLEQIATAHTPHLARMCLVTVHREPSLPCYEVHPSLITNAWIKISVRRINEQIDHHDDRRGEQNNALPHGIG